MGQGVCTLSEAQVHAVQNTVPFRGPRPCPESVFSTFPEQMHALPHSVFRPEAGQDAAELWQSLEGQSADARAKRTDLVGIIALEELASGKTGWRERVQNRISAEGREPVGLKVISDATKIFQLFRLGGDQGLGWTREQMAQHQPGRLRVFAQNREWALNHRDEVMAMIESGVNEGKMRKAIQESKNQEAGVVEEKDEWQTISLRLDPSQARLVKAVLDAVKAKQAQMGDEMSDKAAVAAGQAVFLLASEWLEQVEVYDDGEGGDLEIANRTFMGEEFKAELESLEHALEKAEEAA